MIRVLKRTNNPARELEYLELPEREFLAVQGTSSVSATEQTEINLKFIFVCYQLLHLYIVAFVVAFGVDKRAVVAFENVYCIRFEVGLSQLKAEQ